MAIRFCIGASEVRNPSNQQQQHQGQRVEEGEQCEYSAPSSEEEGAGQGNGMRRSYGAIGQGVPGRDGVVGGGAPVGYPRPLRAAGQSNNGDPNQPLLQAQPPPMPNQPPQMPNQPPPMPNPVHAPGCRNCISLCKSILGVN